MLLRRICDNSGRSLQWRERKGMCRVKRRRRRAKVIVGGRVVSLISCPRSGVEMFWRGTFPQAAAAERARPGSGVRRWDRDSHLSNTSGGQTPLRELVKLHSPASTSSMTDSLSILAYFPAICVLLHSVCDSRRHALSATPCHPQSTPIDSRCFVTAAESQPSDNHLHCLNHAYLYSDGYQPYNILDGVTAGETRRTCRAAQTEPFVVPAQQLFDFRLSPSSTKDLEKGPRSRVHHATDIHSHATEHVKCTTLMAASRASPLFDTSAVRSQQDSHAAHHRYFTAYCCRKSCLRLHFRPLMAAADQIIASAGPAGATRSLTLLRCEATDCQHVCV